MEGSQIDQHNNQDQKRKYDDINYDKRCRLIELINQEKWTIKSAAKHIGIKLCTAKHILYLYRRQGKIYKKKGQICQELNQNNTMPTIPIFYFIPYYIYPQNSDNSYQFKNNLDY